MKQAQILGNPKQERTIDELVKKAGEDRVIKGVLEGKEVVVPKLYQGMMLVDVRSLQKQPLMMMVYAYAEHKEMFDEEVRMRKHIGIYPILEHEWFDEPMKLPEISKKARELWAEKYPGVEW